MKTAVVAIQKNEQNIEEWCRWHLLECQFDSIFLFNHDCDNAALSRLVSHRVIQHQVHELPGQCAQFFAYNAWIMMSSMEYDAALFIDLDEYAVFHGKTAADIAAQNSRWLCTALSWCFFGSKTSSPVDRTDIARRFTWRAKLCNKHVKPFLNLKVARRAKLKPFFVNPHCIFNYDVNAVHDTAIIQSMSPSGKAFIGPYNDDLDDPCNVPYIAHFYAKTEEEFEEKVSRRRCDAFARSRSQYFNQRQHMAEERARCDLNEVHDTELHDKLEKLMGA